MNAGADHEEPPKNRLSLPSISISGFLKLVIAAWVAFGFSVSSIYYMNYQELVDFQKDISTSANMGRDISNLVIVSSEISPENIDRTEDLWRNIKNNITEKLANLEGPDGVFAADIKNIRKNLQTSESLFEQLLALGQQGATADTGVTNSPGAKRARLSTSLIAQSVEMLASVRNLQSISLKLFANFVRRQRVLLLSVVAALVLTLAALVYFTTRRIIRPLTSFDRAISDAGRIEIGTPLSELTLEADWLRRDDEFGHLGRTFDAMSLRLGEMKRELEHQRDRFKLIVQNAGDVIITISEQGIVQSFNPAAERAFGYAAAEIVGADINVLMPEPYRSEHAAYLHNYRRTGVKKMIGVGSEVIGRRKDGSSMPLFLTVGEVLQSDGRIFVGILRDLTQQKEAEADLRRKSGDLERSNDDLQQFAYSASHDLQEPLRMVSSFVQLLAKRYKGKLDADADEFISYAVDGAERMKALIDGLLAFSRITTQGDPFEPIDAGRVLENVVQDLSMALQESGATLTHDPLPVVDADARQLHQVLLNLVGNAIKFRSDRPCRIHVSAKPVNGAGHEFSVTDNGLGVPPEHRDRIFEIFKRLHGRKVPGNGLGLALVKKIVERHGGEITVVSEPGNGASFRFTLGRSNP